MAAYAGTTVVAVSFLDPSVLFAAPELANGLSRYATGEQMAATPATFYRAYRSKPTTSPHITTWLQIDVGKTQAIDAVKLYPACERMYPLLDEYYGGEGFPLRFKIEASDEPGMASAKTIADFSGADFPDPKENITQFAAAGVTGRYVAPDGDRNAAGENVGAFGLVSEEQPQLQPDVGKDRGDFGWPGHCGRMPGNGRRNVWQRRRPGTNYAAAPSAG